MAGESSFDVVSEFDDMEMRNALDQVRREVQQRYDFKGAKFELTQAKTELVLHTDDEFRAKAIRDLIESKAVKRGLSLKVFDWGKIEPAGGDTIKQTVTLRRGLSEELANLIAITHRTLREIGGSSAAAARSTRSSRRLRSGGASTRSSQRSSASSSGMNSQRSGHRSRATLCASPLRTRTISSW